MVVFWVAPEKTHIIRNISTQLLADKNEVINLALYAACRWFVDKGDPLESDFFGNNGSEVH